MRGDEALLGVGPDRAGVGDAIADRDLRDPCADLDDDPGPFGAEDGGKGSG